MYETTSLDEAAFLHANKFRLNWEKEAGTTVFLFEEDIECNKYALEIANRTATVNVYEFLTSRRFLMNLVKNG